MSWHALHLHAGWERMPSLLAAVAPVAERAERWFFIFYGEGGPHLRLRMWLPSAASAASVLHDVCAAATGAGCDDLRPEPYQRELERYGGEPCIAAAEAVFEASSRLALHVHGEGGGRAGARLGWGGLLAAATFARAHGAAGVSTAAAAYARHAARVVRSLGVPVPASPPIDPLVATRWLRLGRALAAGALAGTPAEAGAYLTALARHEHQLRAHPGAGDAPGQVFASHVHMTCNRLGLSVVDEQALCAALASAGDDGSLHDHP